MSREQQARSMHKELFEALNRKNWLRAFVSALITTLLIPIFLIIVHFSKMYGIHTSGIKIFLVFTELFQMAATVVGYLLISQEETDKLNIYFRICFYVNVILFSFIARNELAYSGSAFAYLIFGMYNFVIPIFNKDERRFYSIFSGLMLVITATSAAGASRTTFEVAIFAVLCGFISKYINEITISHEELQVKLKAKTLTSERDPLTGLSNRRGLDKKASVLWPYCIKNRISLGVIEIDIDYFKKYNDKFGHPAGDKCLKQVATAIKKAVSSTTEIVARTGGEEFIVFAQGLDESGMIALSMNIRKAIEELEIKHAYVNVSNYLTVSMGVAIAEPGKMDSFDDLYEEADKALYSAKENGRNCVVCNGKMYGKMTKGFAAVVM